MVDSVVFLSEVLDILAKMNSSMQRELADFSKLPVFLKVMVDQLEHLTEGKKVSGLVQWSQKDLC